ncbi:ZINC FINGER CCHC-TYPE-RELATED [Salix koriyanagi]|uniref:ZINC FINGER CCHC-TYPE-RELATED n=1 Tax=Salix koriyanagi TaxID=2511006 RepID=A0A9Q0UN80_9ROSI|nr:ZINC FINGER CCHC-TYPE-RELATED [Salix koriyanagi]
MASSSSLSHSSVPVFDGEHYHIWAVKMKFFLRSQGLWNIVETDADPYPLRANPTLAQIKAHEEEKLKKDKAITCLHSGIANHIFTKIMNLETPKQIWDKLQVEFEGSSRDKTVKLLAFKREFELMKMRDQESVKAYSGRLMNVVNQMRLLGETFEDHKIVEKLMMSVPEKFEAKISAIEESCDLQHLTIAELISKLHIQEQRVQMRDDEVMEGAFQANWKGRKTGNFQNKDFNNGKKIFSENKSIVPVSSQNFPPCSYCKRTNHAEVNCWFKGKSVIHCDFCKKGGHSEKYCRFKRRQPQLETQQQANFSEESKEDDEHLFMAICDDQNSRRDTWLIDSGCTSHMAKSLSIFSSIDSTIKPKIKLGNGDVVEAKGRGTVTVRTSKEGLALSAKTDESVIWHKSFGHHNFNSLMMLHDNVLIEGIPEIPASKADE